MKVILAAAVAIILAASAQASDKLICTNYDRQRETCLEYYVTGGEPAAQPAAKSSASQTPASRIFVFPSRASGAAAGD